LSLNWKEINLILDELQLPGCQIQKVVQSAFDVLALSLYGRGGAKTLLVSLSPGACRLHETFTGVPKSDKPLRFAQFLNSRIVNGRIEEALQLGDNRIVRLTVRQGREGHALERFRVYIRLWSNAANVIVTDESGAILDAMKRLPKKGEVSGGRYAPEPAAGAVLRDYEIRELPGEGSFNEKVDAFYSRQGGALSLEVLREQARRNYEGSIGRLKASLERLREKEADFAAADRFKEYGNLILANLGSTQEGGQWGSKPVAAAEAYFEQYRKAKSGLEEIRLEIAGGEKELKGLEETLEKLLSENNPLNLNKLLKTGRKAPAGGAGSREDEKRPGLSFRRKDWLIIVGRDAGENDALLRRYVKGNDLWLHARDYPGSYVFIKQKPGKTVPLDILLDAGNLAIFYSKGRNSGKGDLFYTPVKYLRRAKNGPKGLVLPTQEKNLHVTLEAERLRELEACKIEKQ
jgi:predicted ribosome quality control (RQC) complex YloA/Tae2 family protein